MGMGRRAHCLRTLALTGAALASVAVIPAAVADAPLPPVRNVSATPDLAEGEEDVKVNPADPDNVIVGSNQFQPWLAEPPQQPDGSYAEPSTGPSGVTQCAVWSSHDGGATWDGGAIGTAGLDPVDIPDLGDLQDLPILRQAPGEFNEPGNLISADQNVVFDRNGSAWYQCINFGVYTGDVVVPVWRTDDGGTNWSEPVVAFRESDTRIQIDRSFLAIDQSGGAHDGTLYLTFETMFYQGFYPEVYSRASTDGGRTWGEIVRVDSEDLRAMWDPRQYPVVGADGTLYVVYASSPAAADGALSVNSPAPDGQVAPITLAVARSTDGGRTFTQHVVDDEVDRVQSPDEAFSYFVEMISAIAADPTRPGRVAVAWPDDRSGEARILLRVSVDGGRTWTGPIDVADDPPGSGNQHDHVAVDFLEDGRLVVVWRDRRHSGGAWDAPLDVFARAFDVAGDGTATPGTTVRVTADTQPPTTGHHGTMPSEYLAMDATPDGVAVSWDQLAGGRPDNVYRFVPLDAFEDAGATPPADEPGPDGTAPATDDTATGDPASRTGAAPTPVTGGGLALAALAAVGTATYLWRRRPD